MASGGHKRRRWTPEDDARLTSLMAEGWTQRRIGAEIGRTEYSVSARCREIGVHNSAAAKRNSIESQRAAWADRAAMAPVIRALKASWTPERRAMQAEIARRTTATHPYRPPSPQGRARITAALKAWHARRKAWIPADLRAEYARLARNTSAAEARVEIERRIAERKARMTPFERQMEKVRAGAGIVEIRPAQRTESSYSLIGSSMAMVTYG